jgi:hypothetical protein
LIEENDEPPAPVAEDNNDDPEPLIVGRTESQKNRVDKKRIDELITRVGSDEFLEIVQIVYESRASITGDGERKENEKSADEIAALREEHFRPDTTGGDH